MSTGGVQSCGWSLADWMREHGEEPELSDALLPLLPVHTLMASRSPFVWKNMTNVENVYTVELVGAHFNECLPEVRQPACN